MDWIGTVTAVLAAVGGVSGISALAYYKPRAKIEHLNASSKEIDVAQEAMKTVMEVQRQMNVNLIEMGKLRVSDAELWEVVHLFTQVLGKQIPRKEDAENHYCSVRGCKDRVPELGTYKTSNSDDDMEIIMKKIEKLQEGRR